MMFHVIVIILGPLQIKIMCSAYVGTWYHVLGVIK